MTGLLIPEAGSVEILGANMLKHRDLILSKIGSLIDVPIFYEHLSGDFRLSALIVGASLSSILILIIMLSNKINYMEVE